MRCRDKEESRTQPEMGGEVDGSASLGDLTVRDGEGFLEVHRAFPTPTSRPRGDRGVDGFEVEGDVEPAGQTGGDGSDGDL
jgi:hypothetical protein